ncbi:MAG: hypothetical protein G01um101470_654, partial [Parcubacteria group bacterium Gr01-1014_70]
MAFGYVSITVPSFVIISDFLDNGFNDTKYGKRSQLEPISKITVDNKDIIALEGYNAYISATNCKKLV